MGAPQPRCEIGAAGVRPAAAAAAAAARAPRWRDGDRFAAGADAGVAAGERGGAPFGFALVFLRPEAAAFTFPLGVGFGVRRRAAAATLHSPGRASSASVGTATGRDARRDACAPGLVCTAGARAARAMLRLSPSEEEDSVA